MRIMISSFSFTCSDKGPILLSAKFDGGDFVNYNMIRSEYRVELMLWR